MNEISITYNDLLSNNDNNKSYISIYRLLGKDSKNYDCPITLDKINEMDKYSTCLNCNYNFNYDALVKHLDIKYNCPMCISKWTNKEIYINGLEIIKKDLYMFSKLSSKNNKNKIKFK
jgi:predicted Zn-ribbon and HTH transcriptional regulator